MFPKSWVGIEFLYIKSCFPYAETKILEEVLFLFSNEVQLSFLMFYILRACAGYHYSQRSTNKHLNQ
jgi:hypothetical protein